MHMSMSKYMYNNNDEPQLARKCSLSTHTNNFRDPNCQRIVAETQKCLDTLNEIRNDKKASKDMGTDTTLTPLPIDWFYNPVEKFLDPEKKEFLDTDNLPRPAIPVHRLADGTLPDRVKWSYHYLETFFTSGSFYIILDDDDDCPEYKGVLGKMGYVVANGQQPMLDRFRQRIQAGEPLVMLHNTGGLTQAFASIDRIVASLLRQRENCLSILNSSPGEMVDEVWLPEALMLLELNQRAPMLRTLRVVDVMRDQTTSSISLRFASRVGLASLSLVGEAEKLCILTAWKRHMTLVANANKYETVADAIQMLHALAMVTTLLAVMYAQEAAANGEAAALAAAVLTMARQQRPLRQRGTWLDGVPSDCDGSGTVRSKLRPRKKWGRV